MTQSHVREPREPEGVASDARRIDETRAKTLRLLVLGEQCVTRLAEASGERVSAVSSRLRWLRIEGLVTRRRVGRHVYYALVTPRAVEQLGGAATPKAR
jgi:DNA-binding transcriptional ArsR family regulator